MRHGSDSTLEKGLPLGERAISGPQFSSLLNAGNIHNRSAQFDPFSHRYEFFPKKSRQRIDLELFVKETVDEQIAPFQEQRNPFEPFRVELGDTSVTAEKPAKSRLRVCVCRALSFARRQMINRDGQIVGEPAKATVVEIEDDQPTVIEKEIVVI
jgi:hypothetical protein